MTGFAEALTFVLDREGGYVNDPDDPGGATNRGITQATYTAWLAKHGRPDAAVRDIADGDIVDIYRDEYWAPSRAGVMPYPISLVFFDGYVNHRPRDISRALQRAVNAVYGCEALDVDGVVGRKTLAALHEVDPDEVATELIWQRLLLYRTIANNRPASLKFLPGWITRLDHLWAV